MVFQKKRHCSEFLPASHRYEVCFLSAACLIYKTFLHLMIKPVYTADILLITHIINKILVCIVAARKLGMSRSRALTAN